MKSRFDFQTLIIDDLILDQSAIKILENIEAILQKLELHELSSSLERDTGMQIELSRLINSTNSLKQRYLENLNQVDLKVKTLEET